MVPVDKVRMRFECIHPLATTGRKSPPQDDQLQEKSSLNLSQSEFSAPRDRPGQRDSFLLHQGFLGLHFLNSDGCRVRGRKEIVVARPCSHPKMLVRHSEWN